jgi:hypothetical protein
MIKNSRKADDQKGQVRFDAGAGNGFTVRLVRHRQTKETEQIGCTYGIPRQFSTLHSSQKRWQEPFSILSRRQRRRAGEVLSNSINSHGVF